MIFWLPGRLCIYKFGEYLKFVEVKPSGAILLGKFFEVDGYAGKPIRLITHAHADHLYGLRESLKHAEYVVATPVTLDLIEALGYVTRDLVPIFKKKSRALEYHEELVVQDEVCTLLPVDHIPGASQVVVKIKSKNITIGYTGDFKLSSKTEIIQNPNVLVIESTYGNPLCVRPYKSSVPQILVDIVLEGLQRFKRVYVYAYHGKIQEAIEILRNHGVMAPIVLPSKIYRATRLLEMKYGYRVGRYYAEERVSTGEGIIVFKHFNEARRRRLDGSALHVVLTGKLVDSPFTKVDDYTYVVSLSDHADFSELVEYVKQSNPELIVIDGSRSENATELGEYLVKEGYCAVIMP